MEIIKIDSFTTAFIRPEEGVNAGLIHTPEGMILIDTTTSPVEARGLLDAVGIGVEEVRLVINTHAHSDHTWGNQVFNCPILAHRLCQEIMESNLGNAWSQESMQNYLAELEKTDTKRAEEFSRRVGDLRITLPTRVFEERFEGELGGVSYQVIHLGGHTPDLSVVWLPGSRVLYASDLIFEGRYPYIFDADIPTWIDRLGRLVEFQAGAIVPGHGVMCGDDEINALRDYLQETWNLTREHIRLGHSPDETAADPAYPIFSEKKYEPLHRENIRYMYRQLTKEAPGLM